MNPAAVRKSGGWRTRIELASREVHWMVYVLAALFLLRFLYLGGLG